MISLELMHAAAVLGMQCTHSDTALSVGCVIADHDGNIVAQGFSRADGNPKSHAEKIALEKLPPDTDRGRLTLYCTIEPCGTRLSGNPPCACLIADSGIGHVCYALNEPAHFVTQTGIGHLRGHGVRVTQICDSDIEKMIRRANPHIDWQ